MSPQPHDRRRRVGRTAAGTAALIAALTMAGCAAEPAPLLTVRPTAATTPAATASAAASPTQSTAVDAPTCAAGVLQISGSTQTVRFDGECARVEISGADLDVDLDDARIDSVVIRGDRNDVDLD
ncbi:MAG TPA: DUF3060 domain-containing protein, partial [Microbacterium sp.]|nr:DUF3060 domain-containing protein [Microbacterium sp.]